VSDLAYFRDVQYRDSSKLAARANLHKRYTTAPVPWHEWVTRLVPWAPEDRVLEVGCGPGWLWEEARRAVPRGLRLTLADLSVGMVTEALARVRPLIPAATGAVANAESLPFVGGSFGVVVANHMLYHVPDRARAVAEFARVLADGGVLLAATNGPSHLHELDEIVAEIFGARPRRRYTERFGAHNGAELLGTRFGSVRWYDYVDDLVCTNPDDLLAYVVSAPPGERATDDEILRLRDAITSRLDAAGGALRLTRESGAFVCRVA